MADEEIPTSIGDYLVLALSLPTLPAYPKPATHYLYLRQHAPKVPTASDARVLFLVNVPVDATEEHFKHLFETQLEAGVVESVKFEGQRSRKKPAIAPAVAGKKRKRGQAGRAELPDVWDRDLHASGSTALVVFAEEKGARRVLRTVKSLKGGAVGWGEGMEEQEPLGSARYQLHRQLQYPPHSALQSAVDTFMTNYAADEAARARKAAKQREVPDEEGFITVTRGGRTGPARLEDAQRAAEKQEQRKGKGELKNFYRWQLREQRKEGEKELLRRFELDKLRVLEMKKGRRKAFRPE